MGQVTPVTSIYLMSQSLAKPLQVKPKESQGLKLAYNAERSPKGTHTTMLNNQSKYHSLSVQPS